MCVCVCVCVGLSGPCTQGMCVHACWVCEYVLVLAPYHVNSAPLILELSHSEGLVKVLKPEKKTES